jgi:hypothetical protein
MTFQLANFGAGKLLKRPIGDYSHLELSNYFQRYNVHWVIAWTPESRRAFEQKPELLRRLREIGHLVLYEVADPVDSYFERGAGTIKVDLDTIVLNDVTVQDGSVVIRYHYYEHLVVQGARGLRAFPVVGDPVGFIEIVDPGKTVTIRSSHGLGRD